MQLWTPLSRRLVDSDAFARASAMAALKVASSVDAPFFTRKVMDHVWPLINARAFGGDSGALRAIFISVIHSRFADSFAEALAGLADLVRCFPESTTLPAFAAALALWCECRCTFHCFGFCLRSYSFARLAVHRWRLSAAPGVCGGKKP